MIAIEQIPADVRDKLLSEEYFADVNVTAEDQLEISADIAQQLAALTARGGKTGAGVIVGNPVVTTPLPNVPGPELSLRVPITVLEQPSINRDAANNGTAKTGAQIAFRILQILARWQDAEFGIFYADPAAGWRESDDFVKLGFTAIDLNVIVVLATPHLEQVSTPTIFAPATTVTLANITSGATIKYTTDGSFPGSGNAAALTYSAPFTVASGTTVRWAAYKTGLRGSDVGSAVIT